MPWRPLPRIAFAICTYPFQPSSPADLPLEIGDELYIIEQGGKDGSWYRGYLVAPPSLLAGLTSVKGQTLEARVFSGIFPRCCVEVREVLGEGKGNGQDADQKGYFQDQGVRPSTRGAEDEPRSNGVLTPTESASASPPPGHQSRAVSKGSLGFPLTAKGPEHEKRLMRNGSNRTAPSEQSQGMFLPLSPISVSSPRDPNSPRPPAPVPMLKIGDETPTSLEEPLVDEIASCLREWHSTKLHELLLSRRYSTLDKTMKLVHRLDSARRQLLHNVLTKYELQTMREATVWDLVTGNKMLSGEVIVRSPSEKGRILTSDDSAIEITCLQSMMSLLNERPVQQLDEHILHHLCVNIKHFTGDIKQPTTICMYLCSKTPGSRIMPLSEVFMFDLASQEAAVIAASEEKMKTLFVDLSSVDVGEGAGADTNLYLVFKFTTHEPFRSQPAVPSVAPISREGTPTPTTNGVHASSSVKSGRRSLMWGQKGRKESDANKHQPDLRPATSNSGRMSEDKKSDATSARSPTPSNGQKTVKRVVGVGVLPVNQLIKDQQESEQEVGIWSSALPMDEQTEENEGWDELIQELSPSATGRYKKYTGMSRLQVQVKAFATADAEALIKKTPTLLHGVSQTKKIGFSGAPTKPRSDIYLTLSEPHLPRNAQLSHPKSWQVGLGSNSSMANLQLTLEVRKSTGERIENCIFPSGNSVGHTAWRTTACERGEAWNTTIRLAISPDDVPGSHVVMSLADAPGFPFALSWMPLWEQEAFICDGDHSLCLYKYDEYTSSMVSGRGIYLGLPWNSGKGFEAGLNANMATLRLRTYLCSTEYSQDPNLLGLLRWRDMSANEIADLLKRFVFVPEIEIVKLLSEVFDGLFDILVEYAGNEELEDLVFNTLVMVLGITYDRRFNLEPLVDQYANTQFNFPFATSCLIRSFHRLLANPVDTETSRKLRAAFKVGAHIFKFIMRAREQQVQKEAGIGIINRQSTFTRDLQSIFKSLEDLMTNPAPILIGTKTLLVQHFHTWLPELSNTLSPTEVLGAATSFVDSCADAQGKLILYKLILIIQFSSVEAFNGPETRPQLLANTVRWLNPHWGKTTNVTQQYKDQVRLCCSVVASQINELGPEACEYIPKLVDSYMAIQSTTRPAKQSLSLLFPTSYPFPSRQTTTNAEFDEALVEILAVLAATTNLPISIHPDLPKEELSGFLFNSLQVYISSLEGEAFPNSWLSVNIYHHRSTMKTLEKLCGILIDCFLPHPDDAEQFNTDLWRAFFDALLKLVGSDALALETFPEQKRRAVWKIAGDVRELGAELLRRSWEAIGWETSAEDRRQYGLEKMGGYQVQYVPGLVAPIVELCLSVHQGLRGVAIEVLQTMIISEWTLSQDLSLIQTEMIDCLDRLFKTKALTDSILQKLFIGELIDLFEPLAQDADDPLFAAVKDLISTIDELLDLLVAVHSTDAAGEIFHLMDTLHLMEFLKDMQKEDIYIRYVHQLAQLQVDAGNPTEAGLALRLHAELYEWNPTSMVTALDEPRFPSQTAFERKEQLYFEMIKHYEDGMSWNNALGAYMELATQYETNIFDFSKLARTQRAMATVYESISKGERQNPRYFRVVYRGLGFPVGLRDKQFIFEASPNDRLATFTDHMQQQHPSAQISLGAGDDDMEGQYLQISPVSAQKDLTHPIYRRAKVGQSIRDYYVLSRPSAFTTPSKRQGSEAGLMVEQTVQKTLFTTAEAFPTILRRSEIVGVESITLSPVQTAVERTTRKTAELAALEKRVSSGEDSALQQLTEGLMMSVDQQSPTSVSQYRDLLPKPAPPTEDEEELELDPEEPELDPYENALKVALLDHALVVKRCLGVYTRPAQQATAIDLTQRFEITFAPELESLSLGGQLPFFRSPNASYLHAPSPDISASTNRNSNSLPVPQPHNRNATAPLPTAGSDSRPTRHEKNRLSLTFLKRSSLTVDSLKKQQTNGSTPPAIVEVCSPSFDNHATTDGAPRSHSNSNSAGRSGSTSGGLKTHRLSFLNHGSSATVNEGGAVGGDSVSLQRSRRSMSSERPKTSRSEQSGQSQSLGDRVTGNVRKRFSMLNLGRGLQSKGSFLGGFGESVAEE